MTKPRVLVIGAGSIGARHATNISAAGAAVTVTDPDEGRAAATGFPTAPFDLDRLDGHDGIVVASPTVAHLDQARAALACGAKVLVEKPLAATTDGLDELVVAGADRVMVGYNLRFHPPVRRLVDLVHEGRAGPIYSARAWFGSWLPDWRPAVDYRESYSARSDLGGGVLLDAIHELDLLLWLLGGPFEVLAAVVDRVGPLDIDVEDTVQALLRLADGTPVHLALDYLSRRYRRGAEVVGGNATIRLDWARQVIEVEEPSGVSTSVADEPVSASYEREAAHFVDWLLGGPPPPVDAAGGAASVALAEAIRAGAR